MELTVISTGSKGNCYVLRAGGHALLLDAGVRLTQIITCVPKFSEIEACLVTHEHQDHAKCVRELLGLGVPVITSLGTAEALEARADGVVARCRLLGALRTYQTENFTIMPFETQHDASEPFGFLVRYKATGETLVYATDTYYLKYTFPGVHYWIVECNYMDSLLNRQIEEGELTDSLRKRLLRSHMSLRRLVDALKANDLRQARAIILVHLSDERSDEYAMVEAVREATGVEHVEAASDGLIISLELHPF